MPPKAKADTKGKGKAKAKDTSDAGEGAGKGKGKGLKPATSINVRHILVCHFSIVLLSLRRFFFAFASKAGVFQSSSADGLLMAWRVENISFAARALPRLSA
jgi:hypothetical protein